VKSGNEIADGAGDRIGELVVLDLHSNKVVLRSGNSPHERGRKESFLRKQSPDFRGMGMTARFWPIGSFQTGLQ
jgi:hypothetical protein